MKKIVILMVLLSTLLIGKCSYKTYIPQNAISTIPDVYSSVDDIMPSNKTIWYFNALIEHESCVQVCGKGYWARRCWNSVSKLKTYWDKNKKISREEGAGLFQLTRAWRKTGTLRFDTIKNLKKRYPKELNELHWGNVYDRPDLQIKAGLLLWRSNDLALTKSITGLDRLWFLDSIYNGGSKYLNKERSKCKLRQNCDPTKWFNNVANQNSRGTKILYGKRTAWDINRHHVEDVRLRMIKYKKYHDDIFSCSITDGNKTVFHTKQ